MKNKIIIADTLLKAVMIRLKHEKLLSLREFKKLEIKSALKTKIYEF